ncbi:MAG: efflux RND transporter permease subunit [Myxococcales bacterium]|nr:efflux RND transporter permease subunit [Myxococcales bacterium]MCB9533836.1 efflux RND transporter permease subunit [Myxococcales bacterium]
MVLSDVSIRRPVFTTMVMVALATFGVIMFRALPVDLFPDVTFPVVTVTTVYPGADPATMETRVSEPIEEVLNSLGGIESLRSVSLESVSQVVVQFELGVDLDVAAQDVRDRVAGLASTLPDGAEAPTVDKVDLGAAPIVQVAVYGTTELDALTRWVEDVAKPRLEQVDGVGTLDVIGGREREVQVLLDPDRLRAQGLTALDVTQGLAAQNLDVPGGRVVGSSLERSVRTDAEADGVEGLRRVVLVSRDDSVVRVDDVARVEDGFEEARSSAALDGEPAIALVVRKRSGANTVAVADGVAAAIDALRAVAPAGVRLELVQDNSVRIRGSLEAVQFDLFLGAVLAVAIILLFLRDLQATVISALALPVSVLGTFVFVNVMGFTLNLMTTLALSLSIGILIDDAIVVIENIVRRRTDLAESPFDAATRGTSEIGLAVLATTLSIVAVFVPVAFMDGMIGQFFYQFGLTVAAAVLISLFVSFTLTPMLSARWLSAHHGEPRGLSAAIEWLLVTTEHGYRRLVAGSLRLWPVTLAVATGVLLATFGAAGRIGFEFTPIEDRSQVQINIELPVGTALEQTSETVGDIAQQVRGLPGVAHTFASVGGGVEERVNTGTITVNLLPRAARAFHQTELMAYIRQMFAHRTDAIISVAEVSAVNNGARTEPLQIALSGPDVEVLGETALALADRLAAEPGFVDVDTSYRGGRPELSVDLDAVRASDRGITSAQVGGTVRTLIAGEIATELPLDGDRVDVRVRLPPDLRTSLDVLSGAQVRSARGGLVEIGQIADALETSGPTQIDREARQKQVVVYANLDGVPLGDASARAAELADALVPPGVTWAPAGNAKELANTMRNMLFAMFLAVLCVYLILASQFESFVQPLTIMVSLPFSLIGGLGALIIAGTPMSIFGMIGVIMLMGLVTKNAILLVDYANHLREAGRSVRDALVEAGAVRLRPILMTTAAMVFGMLPVAIGHGDGGEARAPMGLIVIGGLMSSTVLTLIVVPVVYMVVDRVTSALSRLVRRAKSPGGGGADGPRGSDAFAGDESLQPQAT